MLFGRLKKDSRDQAENDEFSVFQGEPPCNVSFSPIHLHNSYIENPLLCPASTMFVSCCRAINDVYV